MCTGRPLAPSCDKSGDEDVGNEHAGNDSHLLIEPAAASGDKDEDSARTVARRSAVVAEIARRSHDPEFDLTDAARNLGLSRRYIQRLLEGTGKSFTEHVLEWRLQRVHAMLIDSRYEHMAIIDIALASGFSDVSHFNHMFRQRFGAAPSSVRANALGPNKS
jgi:transcriptional regulator GlxA family with amidase domain